MILYQIPCNLQEMILNQIPCNFQEMILNQSPGNLQEMILNQIPGSLQGCERCRQKTHLFPRHQHSYDSFSHAVRLPVFNQPDLL